MGIGDLFLNLRTYSLFPELLPISHSFFQQMEFAQMSPHDLSTESNGVITSGRSVGQMKKFHSLNKLVRYGW